MATVKDTLVDKYIMLNNESLLWIQTLVYEQQSGEPKK